MSAAVVNPEVSDVDETFEATDSGSDVGGEKKTESEFDDAFDEGDEPSDDDGDEGDDEDFDDGDLDDEDINDEEDLIAQAVKRSSPAPKPKAKKSKPAPEDEAHGSKPAPRVGVRPPVKADDAVKQKQKSKKDKSQRLQKLMSEAGFASRRESEILIIGGRVKVNGKVMTDLGSKATIGVDRIEVDGKLLSFDEDRIVIMLHKPAKVVVTLKDPQNRATVMDYLQRKPFQRQGPDKLPRIYPVGRLDYDASGLLLMTNDGELAERMTHPRYHVPKNYLAKVSGVVEARGLERIRKGILLKDPDGKVKRTLPADVNLHRKTEKHAWYNITVVEGRNHLIKRLFEAVGNPVRRLLRIEIGGVKLGDLPEGEWRALNEGEVNRLTKWSENSELGKAIRASGWAERVLANPPKKVGAQIVRKSPRREAPVDEAAEGGSTEGAFDAPAQRRPGPRAPRREGGSLEHAARAQFDKPRSSQKPRSGGSDRPARFPGSREGASFDRPRREGGADRPARSPNAGSSGPRGAKPASAGRGGPRRDGPSRGGPRRSR